MLTQVTDRQFVGRWIVAYSLLAILCGCSNVPQESPAPPVDIRMDLRERLAYRHDRPKGNEDHVPGGSPTEGKYAEPPPGTGLWRHMSPEQTERLLGQPTEVGGGENTRPGDTYLIYHRYEKWGLQRV